MRRLLAGADRGAGTAVRRILDPGLEGQERGLRSIKKASHGLLESRFLSNDRIPEVQAVELSSRIQTGRTALPEPRDFPQGDFRHMSFQEVFR